MSRSPVACLVTFILSILMASLAAKAQQRHTVPRIGILTPASEASTPLWEAFRQGLRALGYVEGQNILLEYRFAAGKPERFAALAAELVRLQVDLLVTDATPATKAAKDATSTIPIVMTASGAPVEAGVVASLARPGGNVTGVSSQGSDLAQKLVELLRELLPKFGRVAILSHIANPLTALQSDAIKAAATSYGIDVATAEIRGAEDIAPAIEALQGRTDALIVPSDPLNNTHRIRINALALKMRLPTAYLDRIYVEAGGLLSYGPNWSGNWRRAADYVNNILRGAKPADLPVEQPTRLEFVINLKTAKALGLTLPRITLARADDLIE